MSRDDIFICYICKIKVTDELNIMELNYVSAIVTMFPALQTVITLSKSK